MTPGPAGRKCTPYLLAGPGGMPLVLPLSEGLGLAFAEDPFYLEPDQPLEAWQVEVHAREAKFEIRPRLKFGGGPLSN